MKKTQFTELKKLHELAAKENPGSYVNTSIELQRFSHGKGDTELEYSLYISKFYPKKKESEQSFYKTAHTVKELIEAYQKAKEDK